MLPSLQFDQNGLLIGEQVVLAIEVVKVEASIAQELVASRLRLLRLRANGGLIATEGKTGKRVVLVPFVVFAQALSLFVSVLLEGSLQVYILYVSVGNTRG